jgi:hypothetical protein
MMRIISALVVAGVLALGPSMAVASEQPIRIHDQPIRAQVLSGKWSLDMVARSTDARDRARVAQDPSAPSAPDPRERSCRKKVLIGTAIGAGGGIFVLGKMAGDYANNEMGDVAGAYFLSTLIGTAAGAAIGRVTCYF